MIGCKEAVKPDIINQTSNEYYTPLFDAMTVADKVCNSAKSTVIFENHPDFTILNKVARDDNGHAVFRKNDKMMIQWERDTFDLYLEKVDTAFFTFRYKLQYDSPIGDGISRYIDTGRLKCRCGDAR